MATWTERWVCIRRAWLPAHEKLGDIRGKSATLHAMANVIKRATALASDLDRALGLYQESLAILEKLGDISGMTTTLFYDG